MSSPSTTETETNQPQDQQDSALADLMERTYSNWETRNDVANWLQVRGLMRAGNLTHQNAKDLRRRLGRESPDESAKGATAVDEEMKVNSPTITHIYPEAKPPASPSPGVGKMLAAGALGAALLGVPAAGLTAFAISALTKPASAPTQSQPFQTSDETLDIGLGRFSDLMPQP